MFAEFIDRRSDFKGGNHPPDSQGIGNRIRVATLVLRPCDSQRNRPRGFARLHFEQPEGIGVEGTLTGFFEITPGAITQRAAYMPPLRILRMWIVGDACMRPAPINVRRIYRPSFRIFEIMCIIRTTGGIHAAPTSEGLSSRCGTSRRRPRGRNRCPTADYPATR